MSEIYNGLSALFLLPASFLVTVISSFSKELIVYMQCPRILAEIKSGWLVLLFIVLYHKSSHLCALHFHLKKKQNICATSAF